MPAKTKSSHPVRKKTVTPELTEESKPVPVEMKQAEAVIETETPDVLQPAESEHLEEMLEANADESTLERRNNVLFGFGIFVTIAVICCTVVVFFIYLRSPQITPSDSQKKPAIIEATVTPVPVALTLEVINGSGVSGAAAKAASELTAKGYAVVAVGNGQRAAVSAIYVSPLLSDTVVNALIADTNTLFGIGSSSGALSNSTATARLVLGAK